jgi:hypothetical protein
MIIERISSKDPSTLTDVILDHPHAKINRREHEQRKMENTHQMLPKLLLRKL